MMPEDQFRIQKGMTVVDQNGQPLGQLENIYSEDQSHRSRFINVSGRLFPVEAIDGVQENRVKLRIPQERLGDFPRHPVGSMPSMDEQRQAMDAIGGRGPGA